MGEASVMIHVVLATILVGPQVLLFFAVTPASWLIEDDALRTQVVRVIARRFAVLAIAAIVGLVITGLFQYYNDAVVPPVVRENVNEYQFGPVFVIKMTLVTALVGLIIIHGVIFARRIAHVTAEVQAGRMERYDLEQARRNSLLFSGLMILVSVAIVMLGVALRFSHEPL